jgi:hypothetical protein
MTAYLEYTKEIAESTAATRNRVIDFWRALAICVVVFGHWLAASIWLRANGEITLMNSLEWIPYSAWLTWIVQVMPIFFRTVLRVSRQIGVCIWERPRSEWRYDRPLTLRPHRAATAALLQVHRA